MTRLRINIDAGGSFASLDLARDGEWLVLEVSHTLFSWRLDALAAALTAREERGTAVRVSRLRRLREGVYHPRASASMAIRATYRV